MTEGVNSFELEGSASLLQLNARKEGPEDHKVLATDLKLRIVTSNDILLSFHPQLRLMLFDKDGEPRFTRLGTVSWDQEFQQMALEMNAPLVDRVLKFSDVKLRKFTFEARKAGQVDLVFQATVKPDKGEFDILGQVLCADYTGIKIFGRQADLFVEKPAAPPAPAAVVEQPAAVEEAAPIVEVLANSVDAVNPAGIPLGFKLDKRQHPVGTSFEDGGIVYDVTGQGAKTITLAARIAGAPPEAPEIPPPPPLTEITADILAKIKGAGKTEAAKHEDDRDFEAGFARACQDAGLSRADVDEFLTELQSEYTEGWETETTP